MRTWRHLRCISAIRCQGRRGSAIRPARRLKSFQPDRAAQAVDVVAHDKALTAPCHAPHRPAQQQRKDSSRLEIHQSTMRPPGNGILIRKRANFRIAQRSDEDLWRRAWQARRTPLVSRLRPNGSPLFRFPSYRLPIAPPSAAPPSVPTVLPSVSTWPVAAPTPAPTSVPQAETLKASRPASRSDENLFMAKPPKLNCTVIICGDSTNKQAVNCYHWLQHQAGRSNILQTANHS